MHGDAALARPLSVAAQAGISGAPLAREKPEVGEAGLGSRIGSSPYSSR